MPKPVQAGLMLACTLALLFAFMAAHTFQLASDALDAVFHVPPKWTQVDAIFGNANTQELSRGEAPAPSLQALASYWAARPTATRLVFVGNSQMHTVSLAKGESRPTSLEKTYIDHLADHLHQADPNLLTYRLSTSGMSYPEALWELVYMMHRPELKPDAVILQLNYQAFWTIGVRDSFLPLLDDPIFRRQIEAMSHSSAPYAEAFDQALHQYASQPRPGAPTSIKNGGSPTTFSPSSTPGYAIETLFRKAIDYSPLIRSRALYKDEAVQFLYRCRLYFLRLKPSTARSVTGSRLLAGRSAVLEIVHLCHAENSTLFLFSAPVNPLVSLYRTPADRASFEDFIHQAAAENGGPIYDFEDTIPAPHWGNLLNGPDPLHMGRQAHLLMAEQMYHTIPLSRVKSHR